MFYGPFNCISFYKSSRQLSVFLVCSSRLISALLALSTICQSLPSPDIIRSDWLGSKHQPTNSLTAIRWKTLDTPSVAVWGVPTERRKLRSLVQITPHLFKSSINCNENSVFHSAATSQENNNIYVEVDYKSQWRYGPKRRHCNVVPLCNCCWHLTKDTVSIVWCWYIIRPIMSHMCSVVMLAL